VQFCILSPQLESVASTAHESDSQRVYPSPNLDYGWTQQHPTEYHAWDPDKVYVAPISPAGDFSVTWKRS